MTTLAAVECSTAWTLIYDATVSGDFYGGVSLTSGLPAVLSVQTAPPAAGASGVPIASGESLPIGLAQANNDKLYGRALYGSAFFVLG